MHAIIDWWQHASFSEALTALLLPPTVLFFVVHFAMHYRAERRRGRMATPRRNLR